jgi:DNA-directed RNA polymerase subunit beta
MEKGSIFSEKHPIYLNPEEESQTRIAFSDIPLTTKKAIKEEYLSSKENSIFGLKRKEEINFMTTSPFQLISLATALIPFVEHNDANRALMGSNMQRQAVPLLYTQKPIVGTGLEMAAILDSGMIIKSYCQGKVIDASSTLIKIKDKSKQTIHYLLRKYFRSNQETAINQRPLVWAGEKVFSGQIIADGPGTNDGELALGRNLILAYMPWEGYNYEDAIVINERVLIEDCLTSVHIEEHETNLGFLITGKERLTKELKHLTTYICRHLDETGIVKIGSYVKEHDILVGKLTPCDEETSPEAKLIKAIFGNKDKQYRDTSLRVPHGTEGRVVDIRKIETFLVDKDEPSLFTSSQMIRIYIAQIRKLRVGDKLAGRHGNKGIISRVLSRQDMPYLPDGTPVDILFNPLGVPSRMNVGQVFECLLGLAGDQLGYRYKISPFDEIYGKEASRILVNQKLKQASFQTKKPWLFYSGYPGKILLRDGRTGEYFDNPITVGKSYILKLIHLVEDKIHARATGPYSMITEQPLAGKAQKGGQRFGEMEVWALEGYGCSNTLQELLTIKSDDMDGRNDIYESILVRKESEKPTPSIPEAFLALMRELNALGLDFCMQKIEGGFYSTSQVKSLEKDIFTELEDRLKLRTIIARKKNEELAKLSIKKNKKEPQGFNIKNEIESTPKQEKQKEQKESKKQKEPKEEKEKVKTKKREIQEEEFFEKELLKNLEKDNDFFELNEMDDDHFDEMVVKKVENQMLQTKKEKEKPKKEIEKETKKEEPKKEAKKKPKNEKN